MKVLVFVCCLILSLGGCSDKAVSIALGTVERDRIELSVTETEIVQQLLVEEGQRVTVGQPLLQLDNRTVKAELSALVAAENQAAARVAELERGPRLEKIAHGRAVVAGSRSQLSEAQQNYERIRDLNRKKLASQATLDQARAKYESAMAKLAADQQNLNALTQGTTAEELQQARQGLLQAQATVTAANIRLEKLTIKAPRNGVIDDILVELGEQPAKQQVVVVMLSDDRQFARVFIPQSQRVSVVPGKMFNIHIDGVAEAVRGRVRKVSSDPAFTPYYALNERDQSRLVYLAEIDFEGDGVDLLPAGLPVQVELDQ